MLNSNPLEVKVLVGLHDAVMPVENAVSLWYLLKPLNDQSGNLHQMSTKSIRYRGTYCLPVGTRLGFMSFAFKAENINSIPDAAKE